MVRNVAHLHGACALPEDDGYPEAWFTAHDNQGPKFNPQPSCYPNCQPAATLWYHDHCLGITRLNVYAGLAGFYLLRDEAEEALNLPGGKYEIPLMLQDRLFHRDGSLYYPKVVNGPVQHPIWIQEFYGDMNCVNGKVMPFLEVEPRRYRFRIVNASNARFYHLRLFESDATVRLSIIPGTCPPSTRLDLTAACCLRLWNCTIYSSLPANVLTSWWTLLTSRANIFQS